VRVHGTGLRRARRLGRVADYLNFLLRSAWRQLTGARVEVVVVMTTPPMLAVPAMAIAAIRGSRIVFWVMDVYPDLAFELGVIRSGSILARLLRRLSGRLLRTADVVVALGESMSDRLRSAGASRVEVVHNWADGEAIRPRPTSGHALRTEWGWDGRFVVMYSGNLGLAHEFDTVLEAARILRTREEILFAFVGAGPRRDDVERRSRELGLSNVEFRPWVEQDRLGESLTAGDVHLVTLRERLTGLLVPSKIYGILAAGRATLFVGPSGCEVDRIVTDGPCGCSVAPGDAETLVRRIVEYADDRDLLDRHGRAARELFVNRFDRVHALDRLSGIVRGLGERT
jgi:glycosyltransferase involved in cell wall biosynthesis